MLGLLLGTKHLQLQMVLAPYTRGAEAQAPRFGLRVLHKVSQRIHRQLPIHREERIVHRDTGDRHEVVHRHLEAAHQQVRMSPCRAGGQQQRVPVRWGRGQRLRRRGVRSPRPVGHDHWLAQDLRQLFRDHAPREVEAATRGEGHDDRHGPGWKGLIGGLGGRLRRHHHRGRRDGRCHPTRKYVPHSCLLCSSVADGVNGLFKRPSRVAAESLWGFAPVAAVPCRRLSSRRHPAR